MVELRNIINRLTVHSQRIGDSACVEDRYKADGGQLKPICPYAPHWLAKKPHCHYCTENKDTAVVINMTHLPVMTNLTFAKRMNNLN